MVREETDGIVTGEGCAAARQPQGLGVKSVQPTQGEKVLALNNDDGGAERSDREGEVSTVKGKKNEVAEASGCLEVQVGEVVDDRPAQESQMGDKVEGENEPEGLERLTNPEEEGSGMLDLATNLDTIMEECHEKGMKGGRKWTRVGRGKVGENPKVSIEKHTGKAKKRERDKLGEEEEMSKKRAVAATECQSFVV
ncbi:hypothetical protein BVRB_2g032610 [Beta vulgaris subsp. vulgaris]|nr:hypothetical protein BVRB_2g032610 [Beta vulgaris subsp. vulgaris]